MLKFLTIDLDQLVEAPWRFTADPEYVHYARPRVDHHPDCESAQRNIQVSLEKDGQLSPIHVRPLEGTTQYQILDGHVVVECARNAGLQVLEAVVHLGLSDEDAHKRYLFFNLNRARQYRVKMMRDLKALFPARNANEVAAAVGELCKVLNLDPGTVEDYLTLDERDPRWRKWAVAGYFNIPKGERMTEEEWDQLRIPDSAL
jgi:hypothetical protein